MRANSNYPVAWVRRCLHMWLIHLYSRVCCEVLPGEICVWVSEVSKALPIVGSKIESVEGLHGTRKLRKEEFAPFSASLLELGHLTSCSPALGLRFISVVALIISSQDWVIPLVFPGFLLADNRSWDYSPLQSHEQFLIINLLLARFL